MPVASLSKKLGTGFRLTPLETAVGGTVAGFALGGLGGAALGGTLGKVAGNLLGGSSSSSKRRRHHSKLLTSAEKSELEWIQHHLGKTAAAERVGHYRA